MSDKYHLVDRFCKALGHHGMCPEGLDVMGKVRHFLDEEVRENYDLAMADLRAMFAPVDVTVTEGDWKDGDVSWLNPKVEE